MDGISPRYIQDKISNAIVRDDTGTCVNPFMVLNELESGLHHHSLITREEVRKRYRELLSMVKQEYEDVVKNEVQKAISADEEAIARLCGNYVDNIKAYTFREKVRNKFTGQEDDPDERLMRSIEEKIDISESRKDDFRREIMNYIAALALEGKQFDYRTNERLQKALELKLFEDQKDSIKLTLARLQRGGQGHAGEDRHRQGPPHQELRVLRRVRSGRPQLRGLDLRARGQQAALGRVRRNFGYFRSGTKTRLF